MYGIAISAIQGRSILWCCNRLSNFRVWAFDIAPLGLWWSRGVSFKDNIVLWYLCLVQVVCRITSVVEFVASTIFLIFLLLLVNMATTTMTVTRPWTSVWFLLFGCCMTLLFLAFGLHGSHTTFLVASHVIQQASYQDEGQQKVAMPLAEPHIGDGNITTFQLRGLQQQEQERYPHKLHLAPPHVPPPKLVLKNKDNPTGKDQFCNSYKTKDTCLNTRGRCEWFPAEYCAISCQTFIKESSCIILDISCRWVDGQGCIRKKRPRE